MNPLSPNPLLILANAIEEKHSKSKRQELSIHYLNLCKDHLKKLNDYILQVNRLECLNTPLHCLHTRVARQFIHKQTLTIKNLLKNHDVQVQASSDPLNLSSIYSKYTNSLLAVLEKIICPTEPSSRSDTANTCKLLQEIESTFIKGTQFFKNQLNCLKSGGSVHTTCRVEETSEQRPQLEQKVEELFQKYSDAYFRYFHKTRLHHNSLSLLWLLHEQTPQVITAETFSIWITHFLNRLTQFSSSIAKHLQTHDQRTPTNDLCSQHLSELKTLSTDLQNRVSNKKDLPDDQLHELVNIFEEITPLLQFYSQNISENTSLLNSGILPLIKQPPVASPAINSSSISSSSNEAFRLTITYSKPQGPSQSTPLPYLKNRTGVPKSSQSVFYERGLNTCHSNQRAYQPAKNSSFSSSSSSSSSRPSHLENPKRTRKRYPEETRSSSSSKRRKPNSDSTLHDLISQIHRLENLYLHNKLSEEIKKNLTSRQTSEKTYYTRISFILYGIQSFTQNSKLYALESSKTLQYRLKKRLTKHRNLSKQNPYRVANITEQERNFNLESSEMKKNCNTLNSTLPPSLKDFKVLSFLGFSYERTDKKMLLLSDGFLYVKDGDSIEKTDFCLEDFLARIPRENPIVLD